MAAVATKHAESIVTTKATTIDFGASKMAAASITGQSPWETPMDQSQMMSFI